MIDATDREILKILQHNARISNAEIARQVRMAPSAILERIRKLESRGVIQGYETRIDPEALGVHLLAFIYVRSGDRAGETRTGEMLAEIEEVQEVHHIAGEDCFLVKVRVRDARTLGRLLRERFTADAGVQSTRTTIVLETLLEQARLPLDPLDPLHPLHPLNASLPAADAMATAEAPAAAAPSAAALAHQLPPSTTEILSAPEALAVAADSDLAVVAEVPHAL